MRIARLIGRLVIGGLFFAHGTQKLFGWFGGPGPEKTSAMMEKLEMHPGHRNALAAGASEAVGGLGVALGALTPFSAAALIGTMITAIRKVHLKNGFFIADGGYEFNLTLIAALLILVDGGPGPSIDSALGLDDTGPKWALFALAAGAAGSTIAIAAGAKAAPQVPDQAPAEPSPTPATN